MATYACETCRMRSHYEKNPRSIRGRLWLWHTKWCPGWKAFMKSLKESADGAEPKTSEPA